MLLTPPPRKLGRTSAAAPAISQLGVRIVCDLQRDARKHMKGLARTNEKCEGGGDIIDLFIRARFIQGLYDAVLRQWLRQKEM